MAFWNKFPYTNFHEINLDWIIREMKKISGSVSDFARQWEKALQQETGERQEADRQLQENIDAEQDRAEAAEEALGERIDQEIKDRQEADQAEQTAREESDKQLQANIDAEQARAEAAEKALDDKITAETERATAAESNLQEQITAEVNRATAKENELDQKITAETGRATAREDEIEDMITTETQRATAAEGALGDRIDGLEGELEGVTGADSPFIRKDGSTTTTGKIPLAQGGTSEVDPAAATDLVNLRSMQAADQALESSMTEYVDNQLESAAADVHSIPAGGAAGQVLGKVDGTDYNVQWVDQTGAGTPGPEGPQGPQGPQGPKGDPGPGVAAGGTAGQVLSKVDATDYNTQWVDPPGGSDPDAIKKDGSTITTAEIPMLYGVSVGNAKQARLFNAPGGEYAILSGPGGGPVRVNIRNSQIDVAAYGDSGAGPQNAGLSVKDTGFVEIMSDGETGTSGQVLTAKGDGACEWADAAGGGFTESVTSGNITYYTDGHMVIAIWTGNNKNVDFPTFSPAGNIYQGVIPANPNSFADETIPVGYRPPAAPFSSHLSFSDNGSVSGSYAFWGSLSLNFYNNGEIQGGASVISATETVDGVAYLTLIIRGTVIGCWPKGQ